MSGKKQPESQVNNPWMITSVKAIFASLGLGALVVWIVQIIHFWQQRRKKPTLGALAFKHSHQGISSAEVKARQTDQVLSARVLAEKQAAKERLRSNIFTVFNVTIIVLAVSQVLLKDPLGALGTLGTLVLSVSVNIFQETRAARRVEALAARARPMASVIRDGRLQSIDQDELVVGDVLVAGKGDEILVEGILLESTELNIAVPKSQGNTSPEQKQPGDLLSAGTYCETGWVIYQAKELPIQKPDKNNQIKIGVTVREKTPLQKIIEQVLYVLLVIVGVFYIYLFLEVMRIELFSPELLAIYREVMSVIFSILPSGLLLMIVINYAVGSADIARSDVLVRNSQTIESLAQVSTVGFVRRDGAMGLMVELEMLPAPAESLKISERRIRQALGNYVHSIPEEQYPLSIIKERLDGEPRSIHQQARYLSLYGWEAMTFLTADLPGSYVIGYPEILAPYLAPPEPSAPTESLAEATQKKSTGPVGRLRKWFERKKAAKKNESQFSPAETTNLDAGRNFTVDHHLAQKEPDEKGVIKDLRRRLSGLFRRKVDQEHTTGGEGAERIRRLLFAYSPENQSLYDGGNFPRCPQNLTPLCEIHFIDEVRPEIIAAVKIFNEENISIKLLTEDDPANTLNLAGQLGIIEATTSDNAIILGEAMSRLSQTELEKDVKEKTVFARVDSVQMVQVIQALQAQGEHVAVFGASTADLPVMQSGNLSITRKGSSPTVLNQADLIVIRDSINALPDALQKGQRIVNGVMDVLKLNLTRIAYILILLVVMYLSGGRIFFYHPVQGGMISFFTIILPSIALSFWSSTKTVDAKNMSRLLFHFLAPAAGATSLAVLIIDLFLKTAGASNSYAQLAVTHALVLIGLLMLVFVQPPLRILAAGDDFSGRWEPTLAALGFYILFHVLTLIPLAQRWLRLGPLKSLQDYLLIFLVASVWAVLVAGLWRMVWPERFRRSVPKTDGEAYEEINQS